MSYCPNCNEMLAADASLCKRCGAIFGAAGGWLPLDAPQIETAADRRARFLRITHTVFGAVAGFLVLWLFSPFILFLGPIILLGLIVISVLFGGAAFFARTYRENRAQDSIQNKSHHE